MFRVPIAPLSDGLHHESFQPSAADLGLDPEVFSAVDVDLRLDISGRRVLAQYDVQAIAQLECDRTLNMYDQPVEGSHAVLFVPPEAAPEADDDEVRLLADADTHIDLTEPVRDTIMLAVPLRHVSPAAEALDIETSFGTDGESDTPGDDRWAALRALGSQSDTSSD